MRRCHRIVTGAGKPRPEIQRGAFINKVKSVHKTMVAARRYALNRDGINRGVNACSSKECSATFAGLAGIVFVIPVGHEVGLDDNADIGRAKLRVDHRAISDISAEPQVPFD